jgi:hypothetical protein
MRSHGEAVKRIGRYLLGTRDKGFIIRPDMKKSFECYVDADYCTPCMLTIQTQQKVELGIS